MTTAQTSRVSLPGGVGAADGTEPGDSLPVRLAVWCVRALLLAGTAFAVIDGRPWNGVGAGLALLLTFATQVVARGARARVPRSLELIWLALVAVPGISAGFGLYERIVNWGKFVHAVEGLAIAAIVALVVLGWRDEVGVDLADHIVGLLAMSAALLFGLCWETVEFVIDWVLRTSIQKSNTDSMTDFLWNDLAAVVGALLGLRLYYHVLDDASRKRLGRTGVWLLDGPGRLFDRHGVLVGVVAAIVVALTLLGIWFSGRSSPLPFI
jgi:hypothetical protein